MSSAAVVISALRVKHFANAAADANTYARGNAEVQQL